MLEAIHSREDLLKLNPVQLEELSSEIRTLLVDTVSSNGGHLASNLGAVELTIALHRFLTFPEDKLIWDVGHQCYSAGRNSSFSPSHRHGERINVAYVDGHAVSQRPQELVATFVADSSDCELPGALLCRPQDYTTYIQVQANGNVLYP